MTGTLRDRINAELTAAMKSKSKRRMSTLRLVNAAIKDRDIQNRTNGRAEPMGDAEVREIMSKMIKQRRESAETYDKGNRPELADGEREEIAVIEEFLPRQLSEDEIRAAVQKTLDDLGCEGLKDMGRIMGALKANYAGQMDFSKASAMVKGMLG